MGHNRSFEKFFRIWNTSGHRRNVYQAKIKEGFEIAKFQFFIEDNLKWDASSREWLSLYCLMRNSDLMTIGKTHPSLLYESQMAKNH